MGAAGWSSSVVLADRVSRGGVGAHVWERLVGRHQLY